MRRHAPFLLLLVIAVYSGLVGLDFGRHWDEPERIGTVIHAVEKRELLPSWYNYPSVVHDLILASALPEIVRESILPAATGKAPAPLAFQIALQAHAFLLRTRALFFCISMLSVLGTYAFMCRWRKQRFESLVAAGLVALSWEIGYHARWIAPDVLTAASGTLVLYAVHRTISGKSGPGWLAAAAAAAGLSFGTKYPSGLLLLPVLIAAAHVGRGRPGKLVRALGVCVVAFTAMYLLTTPGTILQYGQFFNDVRFEMAHYKTGHGGGHTIVPGLPHLKAELAYLALVVFSPYPPIACLFFALAVLGAVQLLRGDRWMAAALLVFPVVYVGYMSTQRVMVARNLLVVVPFLAALAGRGAGQCLAGVERFRRGSATVVAITAALFVVNAQWLVAAGRSATAHGNPEAALLGVLADPGAPACRVSPHLRQALSKAVPVLPGSITRESESPAWAAFYTSDVRNSGRWTANRYDYALRVFGPREVNFNYYPSWIGQDRLVLMRMEDAQALGVF